MLATVQKPEEYRDTIPLWLRKATMAMQLAAEEAAKRKKRTWDEIVPKMLPLLWSRVPRGSLRTLPHSTEMGPHNRLERGCALFNRLQNLPLVTKGKGGSTRLH
jgi:hypothetical protein